MAARIMHCSLPKPGWSRQAPGEPQESTQRSSKSIKGEWRGNINETDELSTVAATNPGHHFLIRPERNTQGKVGHDVHGTRQARGFSHRFVVAVGLRRGGRRGGFLPVSFFARAGGGGGGGGGTVPTSGRGATIPTFTSWSAVQPGSAV